MVESKKMHNDYDSLMHRTKHRHNDERGCLQRDDIGGHHEWVPPTGGGRMDDLRHFPHAPHDERAFGRSDSGFGPRDGGDEERGRERDRYNERYGNRDGQCDADSARDRDRDRGNHRERENTQTWRPSKLFNHVNELNKQILNNSDTRELFRSRDGPDRQKAKGKYRGEDRGRDRNDRNDRNNERDGNKHFQRRRDSERDGDRDRVSDRDRQYTLSQRPSKQFKIELNKQLMRITDMRELCDFVSTHAAAFNHVNVATAFRQVLKKPGIPPKTLAQALQNTRGVCSAKHARFWSPMHCQHSAHHGKAEVQSDRSSSVSAGAAGGGDIRGVQATEC